MSEFKFNSIVGKGDIIEVTVIPHSDLAISFEEDLINQDNDFTAKKYDYSFIRRDLPPLEPDIDLDELDHKLPYRHDLNLYKIIFSKPKHIKRSVLIIERYSSHMNNIFINQRSNYVTLEVPSLLFESVPFLIYLQELKLVKVKGLDPKTGRNVPIKRLLNRHDLGLSYGDEIKQMKSDESRWYRIRRRVGLYTFGEIMEDIEAENQKKQAKRKGKRK